ncbi:hypothetical protein ACTQ34_10745 [Agathobaculum sp. LCP25S3_E8]|uniref:hypothetical protein n=1 Tax=Agathobaculum sp. LCP25S3_E8 TaxID=3438735 RepID=UPI003F8F6681
MNKLKNMKLTSVDFVPKGANQHADIELFKSAPASPAREGFFKSLVDWLTKGAPGTFEQTLSTEDMRGKLWQYSHALDDSFESILESDMSADEKKKMLRESLEQFRLAVDGMIEAVNKESPAAELTAEPEVDKARCDKMNIDKSKLTPEEQATFDVLLAKSCGDSQPQDDIYKGLHPAVKAELEHLRKAVNAQEDRELAAVAKKYEVIGKKPEELIPVLKSLKGTSAYDEMISVMDAAVDAVEKSALFTEIGKTGHGTGDAMKQANEKAAEIMKADPNLSHAQALDRVFQQNPELAAQVEKEGF